MEKDDNSYKIYCSRCGAEMKNTSRYCMKCGNLNYNHPDNKSMQKFIDKDSTTYQIGGGQVLGNKNRDQINSVVANNTGNTLICFIINFGLYLLLILLLGFAFYEQSGVEGLVFSFYPLLVGIISFLWLLVYAVQIIFMKANQKWWAALVPGYGNMILGKIALDSPVIGLLTLVPVIGCFISLYITYKLGERFGKNGLLTMLLSPFFIPLIAYGSSLYEGEAYVSELGGTLERDYKLRKYFLIPTIILGIVGVSLTIWGSTPAIEKTKEYAQYNYYVKASKKIVKKIEKSSKRKTIICEGYDFEVDGDKYFYFSDLGNNVYLPFQILRESLECYVRVEIDGNSVKYYVSISDGEYGFPETDIDDINVEMVRYYSRLNFSSKNKNMCKIY